MRILWKVRAWSKDRDFFDRYLETTTEELPLIERYTLEYLVQECHGTHPVIQSFRPHFRERDNNFKADEWRHLRIVSVVDYFENAEGEQISPTEILRLKVGKPNVVAIPSHFQQHDIDLMFSPNSDLPDNPHLHINLNQDNIDCLAYFVRDAQELKKSKFRPPSLSHLHGSNNYSLNGLSEELLRSFTTVFRRLYMDKEPGNFKKAGNVYAQHFLNKRITRWVEAQVAEYEKHLASSVRKMVMLGDNYSFTVKRLLEIFIYTRYAHQPDAKRVKQFLECQSEVGSETELTWLFCFELQLTSLYIVNTFPFIQNELDWYLNATQRAPSIPCTVLTDDGQPGKKRLVDAEKYKTLQEYSNRLAKDLWAADKASIEELPNYMIQAHEMLHESLTRHGITMD